MATTTMVTTKTMVTSTQLVADLGQGAEEIIAKFNEAKRVAKAAEAAKKEAEAMLRELMGDALVGVVNGVERVKISERSVTKVDRELLKEAFPEAYEATVGVTPYTVLTTC